MRRRGCESEEGEGEERMKDTGVVVGRSAMNSGCINPNAKSIFDDSQSSCRGQRMEQVRVGYKKTGSVFRFDEFQYKIRIWNRA